MKRTFVVALVALMSVAAIAVADEAKKEKPQPVTMTGEVLDLYCYMGHKSAGAEHAKCASACIKKGLPIGFLSSDGTVYLITGKGHEPVATTCADLAGKKATITGIVMEQGGMKAIELVSIEGAKEEAKSN
jgi:hypothetical protein